MKLIEAVRPSRYTGNIKKCPTQRVLVSNCDGSPELLAKVYQDWAAEFFKQRPRAVLRPTFGYKMVSVFGTGGNGRWLAAWWFENEAESTP